MSTETQSHQEWVEIQNERGAARYQANQINALYGPVKLVTKRYYSDDIEDRHKVSKRSRSRSGKTKTSNKELAI